MRRIRSNENSPVGLIQAVFFDSFAESLCNVEGSLVSSILSLDTWSSSGVRTIAGL